MKAAAQNKFSQALWECYHNGKIAVIPDIKPKSPQCGDLLRGRNPVSLALSLAEAGAPVISVVTEPVHFGGSLRILSEVAQATGLPVLRKDFISKPEQLEESRVMGASAVLLIASMLPRQRLFELVRKSFQLGLEPLVETHCKEEILFLQGLEFTLMGINNRNILELEMDQGSVETTANLARLAAPGVLVISESSITSSSDVEKAAGAGAHAVLVGTAILKSPSPAVMYAELSNAGRARS